MRAGLYARVSKEEQAEGRSLAEQLILMRRFCEEQGWTVAREYEEPGFVGTTGKRPVFHQVIQDCEARKIDVLITEKMDRFFRNHIEEYLLLQQFAEWGVVYASAREREIYRDIDALPAEKWINQRFKSLLNDFYSRNLSEEIKKGKRARIRQGLSNASQAPYGYQRGDDGDLVDPPAAEVVILAFERYATGQHSDTTIADLLNRKGYKPSGRARSGRWTREGVRYLLTNPFYAGHVQHGDDLYPGQHEAIVSQELFDAVQAVRAQKRWSAGGPRRPERVYLLEGLAVCSRCGLGLVSQTSDRPGRKPIAQYYCPSERRSIPCKARPRLTRADRIDRELGELVMRLRLPDDWRDRLEELAEHREEQKNVEGKRRYLRGKLRRLRDLYLEGDFSKGEHTRRKADLQAQLDALRPPERPAIEAAGETLEVLGQRWAQWTKKERRDMLRVIFEEVRVDLSRRRLMCVKPFPPFVPLFRMDGLEERADGCFYVSEGEEAGSSC